MDGHLDGQSGRTFLKKWTDKSGVKGVQEAKVGNLTFLAFNCEETTPLTATVFGCYTLLYIVYRGILGFVKGVLERRDTLEGVFGERRVLERSAGGRSNALREVLHNDLSAYLVSPANEV